MNIYTLGQLICLMLIYSGLILIVETLEILDFEIFLELFLLNFLLKTFINCALIQNLFWKNSIYSSSIFFFSSTFLEFVENEKSDIDTCTRNSPFLLSVSNWVLHNNSIMYTYSNSNSTILTLTNQLLTARRKVEFLVSTSLFSFSTNSRKVEEKKNIELE